MRIGWVIASRMPGDRRWRASGARRSRPRGRAPPTRPGCRWRRLTARRELRRPPARRRSAMIAAKTSRRTSRRRVVATGDSSPRRPASPSCLPALATARGPRSRAITNATDERTHAGVDPVARSRLRLCRTRRPAWRMRLPPRARAQSRPCATPRRSGPPCGSACPPAWRCSSWRSSPRSPSVLRAAGWRAENAAKFDDAARSRTRSPTRCSRRSPAGTPSGTCAIADSGYGDSERAGRLLPALPAAGARRWRTPFGGSPAALLVAAYAGRRWPRSSAALALLYRLAALELGRPLARADAAAARGVPGGALLRRALLGEPVPAAGGGRLLRGAHRALGLGRAPAPRLASATRSAGLLLLLPLALIWWGSRDRRRGATPPGSLLAPLGIAAYALYLGLAEGDALRFLDVQEAWSRELVGAARGRLGRARGRVSTACASSRRAQRDARLLRRGRRATRSGSPPST